MGRSRGRFEAKESNDLREMQMAEVDRDRNEEEDEVEVLKGFFACYLLCSLSPRHKGHTYIGFTVNPRRRIKQHNGEKRCGAWRTKRGRPWEMAMCIYGFSSNVSALQFEWAWQHPTESLAVRKAASTFKSLSGVANKIKLAYTMLTLPSWENLNLRVNFFSTKYTRHAAGCPHLPTQMRVIISTMDELPCYAEGQAATCSKGHVEEEDDGEEIITKFIKVATDHFGQPVQANETVEELCYFTQSPDRNIASASSTPSLCSEDGGMGKLRPVSPKAELIDLCTPLSCILRTKTKRALFDSEIIDLTDSPLSIQL